MSINSRKIEALKPSEKRYTVVLGKGLSLRVQPTGVKSFVVRICQGGKVKDITLGHFPEMTLAVAKAKAREKQKQHAIDPVDGYTVNDAYRLWKNLKRGRIVSYKDEVSRLDKYIMKYIRHKQLDEISAPLLIKVVSPLAKSGKLPTLKRTLLRFREIIDLAVCAGYIQHNPISRVSRVFPSPVVKSMPAVDWRELPRVMQVISIAPPRIQNFFLFSLCSMLRPGENAMIERSWIENDTLVIPADKMKMKRIHRVPITRFMKKLIERDKEFCNKPRSKYVFPGRLRGNHISKQALAKWLHSSELKGQLVAHGLRSIARSWLADKGIQHEIAEECLAHKPNDPVYRAYQRSDYLDARREIFEQWSEFVFNCAQCAGLLNKTD